MVWVTVVVLAAILHYLVLGMLVGRARVRYGVDAPACTGHPMFERWFRVHQNSLEMLIAFVPAVWLYGWWVSQTWATVLGCLFVAARILYTIQYVRDPATRHIGAGLSFLSVTILVLGCLYGAFRIGFGWN